MTELAGLASFIIMALLAIGLVRLLRPEGLAEAGLMFYVALNALLVGAGSILSVLGLLAGPGAWCLMGLAALLFLIGLAVFRADLRLLLLARPHLPDPVKLTAPWRGAGWLPATLRLMGITALLTGAANLFVSLTVAPRSWDAMTFYLARAAYYLQNETTTAFGANYWAQEGHPKNQALLLVYTLMASGLRENFTQLVQLVAYAACGLAVYLLARRSGAERGPALLATLAFGLLTAPLMQAATATTDLVIAAHLGAAAAFLACYARSRSLRYLVPAAVAFSLALGMKSSVLLTVPALAVVAGWALFKGNESGADRRRAVGASLGLLLLALALWTAPSGYLENWRRFDHPLFPPKVEQRFSLDTASPKEFLASGSLNVLRYATEFISLDGMPMIGPVIELHEALRKVPRRALDLAGIDLEKERGVRFSFKYDKPPVAHDVYSYWGILGFALLWPAVFVTLVRRKNGALIFAVAALVYLLAVSFLNPYDPYRGRHFHLAAIFASAPLAVWVQLSTSRRFTFYLRLVVILGCFSAVSAVLFQINGALLPLVSKYRDERPVYQSDRIDQLTLNHPDWSAPLRRLDAILPPECVVAVCLPHDHYEYPLFGRNLSRTLLPINDYLHGLQPVPENARYLVYKTGLIEYRPGDIPLGAQWFLRDLVWEPAPPVPDDAPAIE